MNTLLHYMLRPNMPLPGHVVEAIGLNGTCDRFPYTWINLTNSERDRLFAIYPPTVTVATFTDGNSSFTAVALTEAAARGQIERAWQAHAAEHLTCCGDRAGYPVADETGVLTGTAGSVWRDGSLYPKRAPLADEPSSGDRLHVGYYSQHPHEELSLDIVEALGLDGTGRDGDDRFPYTWDNLTDTERDQLWTLARTAGQENN